MKCSAGEMDGFGDELAVAILSHLAMLHISFDTPVPFALKCFLANRLFDFPMVRPNIVDGKINGMVAVKKVKRGPKRYHNFLRDNAIINTVRHIKEKYGYDAVRVVDKRTPDAHPSAASIVAEASKIVGMSADGPGKRGKKRGVDESTVSNLWNKRNERLDRP
jgi:hypothetical protein